MMLVLSFLFLFMFLIILILGVVFLKIRVSAQNLDLEVIRTNVKKAEYRIIIGLYLWGFIKVGGFTISNGVIQFLFYKKTIKDLRNSSIYLNTIKPKLKTIPKTKMLSDFMNMKLKLEDLNLDLKFGTDSVIITSILIGILSGFVATAMQTCVEKYNKDKYKWQILPNFEENLFLELNASLKLSYSPILSMILKNNNI